MNKMYSGCSGYFHCPVHGHKRLDDDVFLASLSPQESDGVACSMKQKKIVSGQPADVWQWPLTVCLLHFDTNLSNLIVKKSSVR